MSVEIIITEMTAGDDVRHWQLELRCPGHMWPLVSGDIARRCRQMFADLNGGTVPIERIDRHPESDDLFYDWAEDPPGLVRVHFDLP